MNAITGFLEKMNYVHRIEILVIISVALVLVFIFNSLGLLKKAK